VLWIPFGKTHSARRRLQVPDALRGILLRHAAGKPGSAPLLGPPGEPLHGRDLLRHRLRKLCVRLGLPRVCPHSLRGLNATLALEAGATAHHVAAALGHASFTTTARHYADPSSVANAGLRRVAELLARASGPAPDAAPGPAPDPDDRPEISELAALLRARLSAADLALLLRKLSTPE
jgi:integrase